MHFTDPKDLAEIQPKGRAKNYHFGKNFKLLSKPSPDLTPE